MTLETFTAFAFHLAGLVFFTLASIHLCQIIW